MATDEKRWEFKCSQFGIAKVFRKPLKQKENSKKSNKD